LNKSQVSVTDLEANLCLNDLMTNACFDLDFTADEDDDESMTCDLNVEEVAREKSCLSLSVAAKQTNPEPHSQFSHSQSSALAKSQRIKEQVISVPPRNFTFDVTSNSRS